MFVERDEAPAFNFLFRVLGPIVFIVLLSAMFYSLDWDNFVNGIWRVVIYHLAFRLTFNIARGRALLLNWMQEVFIWGSSIGGAWLLYDNVIKVREYLLPDPQAITNELWLIVALFIYAAFNNIEISSEGTEKRKKRYLRDRYSKFTDKYGDVVENIAPDRLAESIIYTIMVYEDFNRPPLARFVEYVVFPYFSKTLGPMQVTTSDRIDERESVELGSKLIVEYYNQSMKDNEEGVSVDDMYFYDTWSVVREVAVNYNESDDYVSDIRELHKMVVDEFYSDLFGDEG